MHIRFIVPIIRFFTKDQRVDMLFEGLDEDLKIDFASKYLEYGGNVEVSNTSLVLTADPIFIFKCLAVVSKKLLIEVSYGKNSYKVNSADQ